MLIFIDTEFTDIFQRHPKLISIALVPADGQDAFYAELTEQSWKQYASTWVLDNVAPLLDGGEAVMSPQQLRERLRAWFAARPHSCQIAADAEIDMKFLKFILDKDWPANLDPKMLDLRGMLDSTVFDHAVMDYHLATNTEPHHALHDARANRRGWLAYCDANKDRP